MRLNEAAKQARAPPHCATVCRGSTKGEAGRTPTARVPENYVRSVAWFLQELGPANVIFS